MAQVTALLLFTVFFLPTLNGKRVLGQSSFRMIAVPREIQHCEPSKAKLTESNVKLYGKSDVRLFASWLLTCNPTNVSEIVLNLKKCHEGVRTSNNCEHFAQWKFPGGCQLLAARGQFWTSLLDAVTPKVRCPVGAPQGVLYKMQNASFDLQSTKLPLSPTLAGTLLLIKLTAHDSKGDAFFCMEFDTLFTRVRI